MMFGGFDEMHGYRSFGHIHESGEIDLLCFGHSGMNELISLPITSVDPPNDEMGRRALELTLE